MADHDTPTHCLTDIRSIGTKSQINCRFVRFGSAAAGELGLATTRQECIES